MKITANASLATILAATLAACTQALPPAANDVGTAPAAPADAFFANLKTLCDRAYGGKLVAFNESDTTTFSGDPVMHVRDCTETEIRIPFHVSENRSRTWIITRTAEGLRLKHDHRHVDGMPDTLTMYGGDSSGANSGSAQRQEFPADAESKALFTANEMTVSNDNVWALEVVPGKLFAYELRRPNRHFRVEFDVSRPVTIPPPAWGAVKID